MDFHHQKVSTGMNIEEFLRIVFPKQDKYRIAAAYLLEGIAKQASGLDGNELTRICEAHSISRATMQKTFVQLRDLGIVDRRGMKYYLNTEFSSALRRLSDAWRNISKESKFEFNENTLRVNF